MSMATLQLYKNPYTYPDYGNITPYGNSMPCTPNGIGLKNGTISVKGNQSDFMECNYLRLTRNGKTIYAWIDDVVFHTHDSMTVSYSVDAWRTYRNKITLGTQFVERQPTPTDKYDDLLAGSSDTPIVQSFNFAHDTNRVLIVQTRTVDGARKGLSSTPVQPSPYTFWAVKYDPTNWQLTTALTTLVGILNEIEETNIVTMYSIPYMDLEDFPDIPLPVVGGNHSEEIEGFKLIPNTSNVHEKLSRRIPIPLELIVDDNLFRVEHSVKIIVPDAGILDVPDQLLKKDSLYIRQDIDIFSGASNYMLEDENYRTYTQSVRGSSVSSIPILSDAMHTYLSQNQNALTTSLIGDVATMAIGGAGAFASGGVGALISSGAIVGGLNNIISRASSIRDLKNMNNVGNPPAFLGTALAGNWNGVFCCVVTRDNVDNASTVHSNFGYPIRRVQNLTFPSSGYIKTQGCNVSSDGTVPRWAIEEINQMFDNGVLVH